MSHFTFNWPLRVYIEDTDAGGIVFYANYLKYMERSRTEYLRSLGFGKQYVVNDDWLLVVRSVNCDYHKPAMLDDELLVTSQVIEHGASFMVMEQLVIRADELLCRGEVKIVCVDRHSMKPKRIPKVMITTMGLK